MMTEFTKRTLTSIVLIGCFGGAYLHSTLLYLLLLGAVLFLILFFEWPNLFSPEDKVVYWVGSLFYPIAPMVGLMALDYCYRDSSMLIPLYPLLVAWTADTFGYVIGSALGSHKICPTISPGKSWEGLLGSVIGVIGLNYLFMWRLNIVPFTYYAKSHEFLLIISVVQTVIAFLGGIFISYLKRKKGLKDTGHVLPGHGGFLDRFDSVFFVVLVTWLMIGLYHLARLAILYWQ